MPNVALWSKFPVSFLQKLEPKLEQRGVKVVKHISNSTKKIDLTDVDAVLFMNEYCSHNEQTQLRSIAGPQDKKIFVLSRKESFWDRDLANLERYTDMAAKKSIPDEKLNAFCTDYIEYKKQNMTLEKMVPKLKKYWQYGNLTNIHQLQQHVTNLVKNNRAPDYFCKYVEGSKNKHAAEKRIAEEQLAEVIALPVEVKIVEVKAPQVQEKSEWETMYLEEIKQLNGKIAELESKLATGANANKLHVVTEHLVQSVELGFMNKAEAFDKLKNFVGKK